LNSKPKTVVDVTDVRTQGMYQLLDPGFVGLIFSCFSEDAGKVQTNTYALNPAHLVAYANVLLLICAFAL
jgi:hypothetical protein